MLERILRYSIDHRKVVVLLTIAFALLGIAALGKLPIDAVPDITNVQVQINTVAPALSPIEIEKQVTFVVETALAGIPGLRSTRSLSRNGFSQVIAVFEDNVDIYFARTQVSERIIEARESLPAGAEPRMGPISTGLGEVAMWTVEFEHAEGKNARTRDGEAGWQSDGTYLTPEGALLRNELERASYLRTVQDWVVRPQLRTVDGVAGVDAIGGYVKQYHVEPDPLKLVSYGLTFSDVIEALERNNVSAGAGYVEHKGESYLVRAAGRIERLDEVETIAIGTREGIPIYLGDVARVEVGRELRTGSATENGREVVVGTALMLIGANSRTVSAAVEKRLGEVNQTLPSDIHAKLVLNRSKLVNATIATVQKNLAEGALFVIVVLLALLGNVRAALICALAIPLSMFLTAIGMVRGGISGNLMSLGAIDFGLIVDGAVIIVENCLRVLAEQQHELGRILTLPERLETVFKASAQVRTATTFGEAIIIIVYIPILALTGVEGKMFSPMALTVILALVAAFILSITFIPAMVALLIRGRVRERESILIRGAKVLYAPVLRFALRWRWPVVGTAAAAFAGSLLLGRHLGQEFAPTLDEKDLTLQAIRIPSTSLTQSTEMQRDLERTISQFPEVAFVFSKTGTAELASDPMPPNASDTFIILKPASEWPHPGESKDSLRRRIEEEVEKLPGNAYEWTQPIQMRFNELLAGVRGDVAVKVFGDDFAGMRRAADAIAAILREIPGAADVKVEQTTGLPVLTVKTNRQAIARYGLSMLSVQEVVAAAVGGRESGQVFEGDRRFDLVVRLPEELRKQAATLENLPIPIPHAPSGRTTALDLVGDGAARVETAFIPLGTVADIEVAEGPNQVSRENGKRRVVVQANVRGRDLGSFVVEAEQKVRQVPLPSGSWLVWGGQFENMVTARERLTIVVPICFFLIFLLLFSTFGSARYALLVFTGVPLGLTGGIVALWLRDMPLSISAAVGFIALSGVAVLNGLVLVSFVNSLRESGRVLAEAVTEGALTRLRPVLMTALVASLGFVPMAVASGTGAEVQRPLATVVIGGLVSSTLLTLVVLPALYTLFARRDTTAAPA
ncbi:MAG: CusA/CzcA family heavy metal efflux RND transporter [Planctomycetes bacterium]|nr:CusA/CzcA family heavy metal efflux RND transporter [Planctomycetota bacterium]